MTANKNAIELEKTKETFYKLMYSIIPEDFKIVKILYKDKPSQQLY